MFAAQDVSVLDRKMDEHEHEDNKAHAAAELGSVFNKLGSASNPEHDLLPAATTKKSH